MTRPTHEPKHLLDVDAEQNIGNSATLLPQDGSGPSYGTVTPQTNPDRLLMLSGPSKTAQTTSVVVTAARLTGDAINPSPGYAGPVTGIVEFGNGGRFTRVEFDVPVGPFVGAFEGASKNTEPQDGGTVVTVPSGVLRVYARYDNRLIQPVVFDNPQVQSIVQASFGTSQVSLAQLLQVPFAGPGGPVPPSANPLFQAPAEPVLVKAMAAYYTRHFAHLYKTQYCYVSAPGTPPQYINPSLNSIAQYCVPAFARNVQVLRYPVTAALTVELFNSLYSSPGTVPLNAVSVPSNQCPVIPIVGHTNVIRVTSATSNDKVSLLALCYEIGL
jgi:hypothetical protein